MAEPYRGPGPSLPDRTPLVRRGRLRKRWRYVGVFGPELSLCAGFAEIGPLRQSWWAVWDRAAGDLRERTLVGRRGGVRLAPGSVEVRDRGVEISLEIDERAAVETVCPAGERGWIWTRKQAGVPARGTVTVAGRELAVDAPAVIDETVGYHERHTSWLWSAGAGELRDGRPVGWNLVTGVNDPPAGSERTLWVDGEPSEIAPVAFDGLDGVRFADGAELRFAAEATRRREDELIVFRSSYEQPFGTFAGTLPGGLELGHGFGVMERHDARW